MEKGKMIGMDENNDVSLNSGGGGRQEKQDSVIRLPAMLGVGNLDCRVLEKQDSVIRSSAVEDVGDLDTYIGEKSNQEGEEKWTRIERRKGKRKAEPGTTRGTWPALGGSRGDGGRGRSESFQVLQHVVDIRLSDTRWLRWLRWLRWAWGGAGLRRRS